MRIFNKSNNMLSVSIIISCLLLLSACAYVNSKTQKVSPSINIQGNHQWKRIDTELCRFYYYQDDDFVTSKAEEFDKIYQEICKKLDHSSRPNPKENNKIVIFFLDDDTYKKYTSDSVGGACWRNEGGFINLNKKDSPTIASTMRHELIHAVTKHSEDTKVKNCPRWFSEGIAQYYQWNGGYKESIIEDAVLRREIFAWSSLIPESWSNENVPLKYTQAACIYDYLVKKYSEETINSIFYHDEDFNEIIQGITNRTIYELEKEWIEYISNMYTCDKTDDN